MLTKMLSNTKLLCLNLFCLWWHCIWRDRLLDVVCFSDTR